MVLAYHLVLTGYGHWLPNDPAWKRLERFSGRSRQEVNLKCRLRFADRA
jgi:hypothetical protein